MNPQKNKNFTRLPKKPNRKKLFTIIGLAIVVLGIGSIVLIRHQQKQVPTTASGIKLTPATPEEKKESDASKDAIVQQQNTPPATPDTRKQVTVTITSANQSTVAAYVSGVLEDDGTCTATFTQSETPTVTRTSAGFSNVSYTQCAPITPNLPNQGAWSVTINYSSPKAEGKSQAQAF